MTHTHDLRVYYEDTDMAGIVYYANYLRFLERGRSELVRDAGLDQLAMRDDLGIVFAVRRVEVDYLRPARFDDVLTVHTETSELGAASLTMSQRITRGAEEILRAEVRVAVMSLGGKPVRLPAEIRQRLQNTKV
ncbi:tol-pal system-associated acyl-CoA thioesterase [Oceanomicrobium pacificus]|uniref:Tol-pal system-associated acyl-CoA thioesterase n=1 Tax=Oceanomicrobium pacificus TaxID=2692916 RepID=A0A6B0TVR0_9RHOB|nr:tol-pal system-associated acyl-CoA thioesterase [Oceanomicrobium pacificus]MXU65312.1 tol-pal system-associated acyl-CoA thioesterase [Oceanomicrobium pacificus]